MRSQVGGATKRQFFDPLVDHAVELTLLLMRRRKLPPTNSSNSGSNKKNRLWFLPALAGTAILSVSWLGVEIVRSVLRIQRSLSTSSPSFPPPTTRTQPLNKASVTAKSTTNAFVSSGSLSLTTSSSWPPARVVDAWMDEHRRVVVAATNADYVDFCDNFAQSLLAVNVTNFILIALDPLAYEKLTQQLNYADRTVAFYDETWHATTSGEAVFGTEAFRRLTSTRPRFLRPFLVANYTVFYNDIDVVWRRNAWDVLPVTGPLQVGKKRRKKKNNDAGEITTRPPATIVFGDGPGQLCTCLMYLTPNAIHLVDEWMDEIQRGSHATDQFAFIDVCQRRQVRFRGGQTDDILVVRFDPRFPTGKEYDWTGATATTSATTTIAATTASANTAVIVHNNWIKGKQAKLERFQTAGLWHLSTSSRPPLAFLPS